MYLPTKSLRTKPRQLALCLAAALLLTALGLPAAAQPAPETLVYEQDYDEGGRVRTLTPDSGRTATYTYSDAGSEKTLDYAGWPVVTATEFDVHGLPIRTERTALGAAPGAVETATRDDIGRLASHRLDIDGDASAAFDASGFAYDARGYLTGYVRSDAGLAATQSFGYDGQARLASWSVGGATQLYGYDAFGNLESRSALSTPDLAVSALAALYDAANRRVGWDYDAEGRLERDDRYDYRYDRSGRLAAIFTHDGDLVAHYLYDLGGQRIRVFEDGKLTFTQRDFAQRVVSERVLDLETGAVTGEDHLLFAGQAVATVDDQPSPLGELVATQRFTDRLGNPALRWDGEGERHYQDYAPFGTQARVADPDHQGAHGFTGHEDDATGNTYMRARYYDPDASRFQRPDPARDVTRASPSSLNLYQYVRNSPIEFLDPSGERSEKAYLGRDGTIATVISWDSIAGVQEAKIDDLNWKNKKHRWTGAAALVSGGIVGGKLSKSPWGALAGAGIAYIAHEATAPARHSVEAPVLGQKTIIVESLDGGTVARVDALPRGDGKTYDIMAYTTDDSDGKDLIPTKNSYIILEKVSEEDLIRAAKYLRSLNCGSCNEMIELPEEKDSEPEPK